MGALIHVGQGSLVAATVQARRLPFDIPNIWAQEPLKMAA